MKIETISFQQDPPKLTADLSHSKMNIEMIKSLEQLFAAYCVNPGPANFENGINFIHRQQNHQDDVKNMVIATFYNLQFEYTLDEVDLNNAISYYLHAYQQVPDKFILKEIGKLYGKQFLLSNSSNLNAFFEAQFYFYQYLLENKEDPEVWKNLKYMYLEFSKTIHNQGFVTLNFEYLKNGLKNLATFLSRSKDTEEAFGQGIKNLLLFLKNNKHQKTIWQIVNYCYKFFSIENDDIVFKQFSFIFLQFSKDPKGCSSEIDKFFEKWEGNKSLFSNFKELNAYNTARSQQAEFKEWNGNKCVILPELDELIELDTPNPFN